jgi:hypothetical protein
MILMHRVIMNPPAHLEVDHINGNKLDNRRANLRVVSHAVNERSKPKRSDNTSGFKGVTWCKTRRAWYARAMFYRRTYFFGQFTTAEEAAEAHVAGVARLKATLQPSFAASSRSLRASRRERGR